MHSNLETIVSISFYNLSTESGNENRVVVYIDCCSNTTDTSNSNSATNANYDTNTTTVIKIY